MLGLRIQGVAACRNRDMPEAQGAFARFGNAKVASEQMLREDDLRVSQALSVQSEGSGTGYALSSTMCPPACEHEILGNRVTRPDDLAEWHM